jgi:hypothetical protein
MAAHGTHRTGARTARDQHESGRQELHPPPSSASGRSWAGTPWNNLGHVRQSSTLAKQAKSRNNLSAWQAVRTMLSGETTDTSDTERLKTRGRMACDD